MIFSFLKVFRFEIMPHLFSRDELIDALFPVPYGEHRPIMPADHEAAEDILFTLGKNPYSNFPTGSPRRFL
jgi:hypothetical protein